MQLKFQNNIVPPVDGMRKISALAWSSNGLRLAVSPSGDKFVYLYDEQGNKKDKFPTKASDGQSTYVIRALEFSPDSARIALAQSDNIVFVYKLGETWGDRKSICNKFPASSSVTCLAWPRERTGELVFGLAEGKIKCGTLRNNKSHVLYSSDSYCVSLAASKDGESVVSGHLDGSIFAYHMESQTAQKVVTHHSIPYALGWGEQIVAGGNDQKVSFYDTYGNLLQRFDYVNQDQVREFTLAKFNPSGDTVVLGNFNRFYTYHYNNRRGQWEEIGVQHIENYYTVTALAWKNDGSRLVSGSLCGSVDFYDASMKVIKYKGFELNYVSPSQIVVKILANGNKAVVRSSQGEIGKINFHQDRYIVAHTKDTLLICDLNVAKTSEIAWRGSGKEKYDFNNPGVCMVFNEGELTLVEYGSDEPLGNCRTMHMKSRLISCRLSYNAQDKNQGTKSIAYLLDLQTICIQDLKTNTNVAQINHDTKLDYIELNAHANKILFKDKRKQLYLFNIKTQTKSTLLSYCTYAKWVPNSEVVVAQNRQNLCVWYSIEHPDKVTNYTIKGDVETIERNQGRTEVIVNDGNNPVAYALDEPMIEFGFAVESQDLERAAQILDPLDMTPETEANWKTLSNLAIEQQNISVAEHCFASLGDISKASYLRKIQKLITQYEQETGKTNGGIEFYKVQARLAVLEKQFHRAEAILLDHNEVDAAMEMYQELHKWDESIKIAEKKQVPDLKDIKDNYLQWLMQTNQEEKVGEVKENEGDFITAITYYIKAGLPARAANVVLNCNINYDDSVKLTIAQALENSGLYEKAGEFYEMLDNIQKSIDNYCKGNSYKKAIELAKRAEPRIVSQLEERYGDYLLTVKQSENAVNHYIEANAYIKAIEASILSRQWSKAIQLLQHQSDEEARPYYKQIAKHYYDVRQYDFAEKYYLKAGLPIDCFEMYATSHKWENALKVARENLPEAEITMIFVKQAEKFQAQQKYKEAEKLYLQVEVYDLALNMYRKAGQYDNVIRIVKKYRPQQKNDTHLQIAQQLQQEGNYKQAEHHYIECNAWHAAVEMYKQQGQWEEAVHVCKLYGSDKETSELAKQWAEQLGHEEGMRVLKKMNLLDAMIDYLCDRNDFDEAFRIADKDAPYKKMDVHLKNAFFLEDEKRYKEAEQHFIKAGKPQEPINMYEVLGDFDSALQVARIHCPQLVPQILINYARSYIDKREYSRAEQCFLQAKKPELALKMYTDMQQFNEALRIAKVYLPHLVEEIMKKFGKSIQNQNQPQGGGPGAPSMSNQQDLFNSAKMWEENKDFLRAIDTYLSINRDNTSDIQILEQAWKRAFILTFNYDKQRTDEIVNLVCARLIEIQRYDTAAQIYEQVQKYREAVNTYLRGEKFRDAEICIQQIQNNQQLYNELNNYIQMEKTKAATKGGDAVALIKNGQVQEGLNMMVNQNQWTMALQYAQQYAGGEVLGRYLIKYAKFTMENGQFGQTIEAFSKYGMQPIPANYPIYKTLAIEIFYDCQPNEIIDLKNALYNLVTLLQGTGEINTPAGKELARYLMIAHLFNQKNIYQKKDIHNLFTPVAVATMRYCDLVRQDQLYYDAGMALKKENKLEFAAMLLNRYLDVYDIIEDENNNNINDQDFQITDIPSPLDVPLPEGNIIQPAEYERIKDILINLSIEQQVKQDIPKVKCQNCGQMMYEGGLTCQHCKFQYEACIVSGYPLRQGDVVQCKCCGKGALRQHWNTYSQHFSSCPWCSGQFN